MSYEIRAYPCEHQPGLWVAHVVDHEGEGPRGEGKTELSALCELARLIWEDGPHNGEIVDAIAAVIRCDMRAMLEENGVSRDHKAWAKLGMDRAARTVEGMF